MDARCELACSGEGRIARVDLGAGILQRLDNTLAPRHRIGLKVCPGSRTEVRVAQRAPGAPACHVIPVSQKTQGGKTAQGGATFRIARVAGKGADVGHAAHPDAGIRKRLRDTACPGTIGRDKSHGAFAHACAG